MDAFADTRPMPKKKTMESRANRNVDADQYTVGANHSNDNKSAIELDTMQTSAPF